MAWKTLTLTTAAASAYVSFAGRGSIYCEGTFGSGTVRIHAVTTPVENGTATVSTSGLYSIDGSTTISADVPSGHYQLQLNGSTGATVVVWYNDQVDRVISA